MELGEICRVHRGAVTGSNATWVVSSGANESIPDRYLFRTVTKAKELFGAGERLEAAFKLRRVIDLPSDLDELDPHELPVVEKFLRMAKKAGAADGYVARNRKAWGSVSLREPAPILATYMARRVPAFVRNIADALHLDIAHGLYPVTPLSDRQLDRLASVLRLTYLPRTSPASPCRDHRKRTGAISGKTERRGFRRTSLVFRFFLPTIHPPGRPCSCGRPSTNSLTSK